MLGGKISLSSCPGLSTNDVEGLGLLNASTVYSRKRRIRRVLHSFDNEFTRDEGFHEGYEIHYGDVIQQFTAMSNDKRPCQISIEKLDLTARATAERNA